MKLVHQNLIQETCTRFLYKFHDRLSELLNGTQ